MDKDKIIDISGVDQTELFGIRESKLKFIRSYFPKLKIVVRGDSLKLIGDQDSIKSFDSFFSLLLIHLDRYNQLTINNIENLLGENGQP